MATVEKNPYQKIIPALQRELGIKNVMALPKVEKVVINCGVGRTIKDEKLLDGFGRIRDIVQGPDGWIYFATNNTDGRGTPRENDDKIFRIRK